MKRRWSGVWLAAVLIFLFAAMPLWQLADWRSAKKGQEETAVLLYQVTLFQMEMMGNTVTPKNIPAATADLEEWKRAVYSAAYAHERLSMAAEGRMPAKLEGLDSLLQWITRVQVGGGRSLVKEETELLRQTAALCTKIVSAYGRLMNDGAAISGSASGELKKTDIELAEMVKKNLK
ncbi:MAG: S-adenosylmethionine decarboxylase proenzyme [Paenibacillaceae bacterium]|jgi:hypothetical protein|nr:S-adenosylmethionine decarboxylase proenzyme [Paenibacillaceae bacterium]